MPNQTNLKLVKIADLEPPVCYVELKDGTEHAMYAHNGETYQLARATEGAPDLEQIDVLYRMITLLMPTATEEQIRKLSIKTVRKLSDLASGAIEDVATLVPPQPRTTEPSPASSSAAALPSSETGSGQ